MTDQWQELKETITEMRDNDGTGTQQEVCKFLVNYMGILEKQMQEPCEMTAEEYRQRMIQAFHNANTDELIALCVLPTEKEFEHLEWLLKTHYKKEPCKDAISRQSAIFLANDLKQDLPDDERLSDMVMAHNEGVLEYQTQLSLLPPVTPQLEIIRCSQCKYAEVADSEDSQDGYTCQFHRGSIWFSGSYCSWAERRQDG